MLRLFCLALFLPAFLCTLHDYEKEFEEAQAKFGGVAKRTPHDYVMDYMHALEKYGGEGLVKRDAADIKAHINSFIKYAKEVEKINEDSSIPFTAEVNKFSLETEAEHAVHLGLNITEAAQDDQGELRLPVFMGKLRKLRKRSALPASVSWNERGLVTPVKDQKSCGCCWVYSSVAAMETNYHLATGDKVGLAEQEVLDCAYADRPTPHKGCRSGWITSGMKYVKDSGRAGAATDLPYKGKESGSCASSSSSTNAVSKAKLSMIYSQTDGSDEGLMHAATLGAVSVVITVEMSLYMYKVGIFSAPSTKPANHAVTLTGYGEQEGVPYWLVKNSWGEKWGEAGYIRLSRKEANTINIAQYAIVPVFTCKAGQDCAPLEWWTDPATLDNGDKTVKPDCNDLSTRCDIKLCTSTTSRIYKWAMATCPKTCSQCS